MDARHYNPQILVNLRESKSLTQEDVASRLNVTRETVSRVETGRNASYDLLCYYAQLLEVPVTSFLYAKPSISAT